ncbi:hypothetical protein LPJGGPFB_02750 [Ensifer adhaerens]|uniref:Uncharacterized protein n=1 Tax=Ensifer adhaerens TaxID=106592 RepID=A0ACC5T1E7_ENSAD|nr:hypothetical protein [Ensifer adhaerens]MBP1874966.1 hypothetical protein [Ensifer adhaerens]NRP19494.1 hypothetical protein [Ensifer adhaerens]
MIRHARLLLIAPLAFVASCVTGISEDMLDAGWCRRMEAAKADTDDKGRRNLSLAMIKHDCERKLRDAEKKAAHRAP